MPSAPQPLPPAAADFPSLLLPVIGAIVMVLLALAIICLRCRAEEVRREGLPRLDAEEEVAKMRQRELVDAIMREKGLAAAPSAAVPNLQLQSQAARRSMSMPKPLPLPSFRRWTSQASARTAPEMKPQQQLEAWLQQERRSEREIGALRRELEELGHACESELRELEAREIAEMEEAAAWLVAHERKEWAEGLQARQAERDRALLEREEWSAGQGGRAEQMRLADESIRVLLARLKELRKLRKEMLAGGVSRRLRSGTTTQSGPTAAATAATAKPTAAAQQRQRRRKVAGRGGVGSGGDAVKVKRLALSNYVDM